MELEEYLKEYKALTLDIMEQVNTEGNIGILLDEREKILQEIRNSRFKKEKIRELGLELKLDQLEDEMNNIIKMEKLNIKRKLIDLRKRKQGNQHYMASTYSNYTVSNFDKRY